MFTLTTTIYSLTNIQKKIRKIFNEHSINYLYLTTKRKIHLFHLDEMFYMKKLNVFFLLLLIAFLTLFCYLLIHLIITFKPQILLTFTFNLSKLFRLFHFYSNNINKNNRNNILNYLIKS